MAVRFLYEDALRENDKQFSMVRHLLIELHTPRFKKNQKAPSAADVAQMIVYIWQLRRLGFTLFRSVTTNCGCQKFAAMMQSALLERRSQYVSRGLLTCQRLKKYIYVWMKNFYRAKQLCQSSLGDRNSVRLSGFFGDWLRFVLCDDCRTTVLNCIERNLR